MPEIFEMSKWLDNVTLVASGKIIKSTCATATDVTNAVNEGVSSAESFATNAASQAETNANAYTDQQIAVIDLSGYVSKDDIGILVVPINDSGLIDAKYLPSYVDDVVVRDSKSDFPDPGEEDKIYVASDTGDIYRWADSAGYIQIGSSVSTSDEAVHAINADIAAKLGTDTVGNIHQPIWLDEGKPQTCEWSTIENLASVIGLTGDGDIGIYLMIDDYIKNIVKEVLEKDVDMYISDSGYFTLEVAD